MSYLLIKNAAAVFEKTVKATDILIKGNVIEDISFSGEIPEECEIIDANGMYVSPGFIDIHVHGGGGYDFMDCSEKAFSEISKIHLKNGSTTILPRARELSRE